MSQFYSPARHLGDLTRLFHGPVFDEGQDSQGWRPRVDIHEDDNGFVVLADLPGVSSDNVDITLDKDILTIRGERNTEHDSYLRRERISGKFERHFTLPSSVDGSSITARASNGVLEVRIPKQEVEKPRSIEVLG